MNGLVRVLIFLYIISILYSCSNVTIKPKQKSKIDNPELLKDVTLYATHHYKKTTYPKRGRVKIQDLFKLKKLKPIIEEENYTEIMYFDSHGGVIILRPDETDKLKRISSGHSSIGPLEKTFDVKKKEHGVRITAKSSIYSYDPRYENNLCLNVSYITCGENEKITSFKNCYASKSICYHDILKTPEDLSDNLFSGKVYNVNYLYKETFRPLYFERKNYRIENHFEILYEANGDAENLKKQWKIAKNKLHRMRNRSFSMKDLLNIWKVIKVTRFATEFMSNPKKAIERQAKEELIEKGVSIVLDKYYKN